MKIFTLAGAHVCLLLFLTSPLAHAAELPAPYRLVEQSAADLLEKIAEYQQENADGVTSEMVDGVLEVLEPVVDFDFIARAVIGKHRSELNNNQIARFVEQFKSSMVRLYLKTLLNFEVSSIEVPEPEADFDPASGQADVRMRATAAHGKVYLISYTLRTGDASEWKVQNMIVDGVNLGLTYRNQFDSAMSTYNMDADRVINNWDQFLEE